MAKVVLDTAAYLDLQRSRKHRGENWAINTLRHLSVYGTAHGQPGLTHLSVMEISAGFKQELRDQ